MSSQVYCAGLPWAQEAGKIHTQELDWYKPDQRELALQSGPFDFLLAADCVYNEEHLEAFKATCLQLMTRKSLCEFLSSLGLLDSSLQCQLENPSLPLQNDVVCIARKDTLSQRRFLSASNRTGKPSSQTSAQAQALRATPHE